MEILEETAAFSEVAVAERAEDVLAGTKNLREEEDRQGTSRQTGGRAEAGAGISQRLSRRRLRWRSRLQASVAKGSFGGLLPSAVAVAVRFILPSRRSPIRAGDQLDDHNGHEAAYRTQYVSAYSKIRASRLLFQARSTTHAFGPAARPARCNLPSRLGQRPLARD